MLVTIRKQVFPCRILKLNNSWATQDFESKSAEYVENSNNVITTFQETKTSEACPLP